MPMEKEQKTPVEVLVRQGDNGPKRYVVVDQYEETLRTVISEGDGRQILLILRTLILDPAEDTQQTFDSDK